MLFGLFTRKNIKTLPDADLIPLINEGNRTAEGELFIRYSALVMGLCLKYMKDIQMAEDIMMSLFEKLPEKIKRSKIENFKNWLFSVSRNECLMVLRKKKLPTNDLDSDKIYLIDDSEKKLEATLNSESRYRAIEDSLLKLKDEQRICIELFYLKGYSYEEVTRETGYNLNKVKSSIQNAKRNLKLILEGQISEK